MSEDDLVALMTAWDETDAAAQRVLVALPSQMTFAAVALDSARLNMRGVLQRVAKNASAAPPVHANQGAGR
ncbi:hypothetical protein SAMN03159423_0206 [Bradyrhizobium sp. NFR13]|nr:hypothetical protein SAMN03159423_0206 [Bradyrhizobium sp. NFR13]